ncbi:MAG: excinuclease ABC subunit UvrB [Candidatus Gracilibacteria bacterium]|nr:excinuclease ABC subunit UvrB [Candidatus Gracilibacteria bacterium]MDD5178895.1 excinuclease ABC subunit UvrB [Candidatus Gracilibacteria bacterium]
MQLKNIPFKLVSKFQPNGDQPAAIKKMIKNFENKKQDQTLLGVTGSGKTFTIANVIQKLQRPALIVSQNKTLAAQLCSEFREFFPDNAVHYFVSYYDYYQPEAYMPATGTYIEKDASINEEIAKFRHAATKSLLTRSDCIIIASVSCIYGLGDVEAYEALAFELKLGSQWRRDDLLRKLIELQYNRANMDFKRGQFNVLGDIIEIYPPDSDEKIVRLDFFGDEIERITIVDHFTGEIYEEVSDYTLFPAKHDVTTQERIERAVAEIRLDLAKRLHELKSIGKNIEAERLQIKTEYDLEMLLEVGYVSGIENYTRYLSGRDAGQPPSTLLDYFPKDYMLFVDESHVTIPQIGGMHGGNESRKRTLIEHGFRLPSAMDNRPLSFPEFEKRMGQTVYISATPADYEVKKSGKEIVEMIVRPTGLLDPAIEVVPSKNQIDRVMKEIQDAINRGERALITTLTKKSSESLTEWLTEHGVKVKYLHSDVDTMDRIEILRELRLGVIDVIVGINLLREGLDLPEVSVICILDADKEGFLRSSRSLIQTIGRCARNVNGHVVMFADRITDSMKQAIGETDRRREIQAAYNIKHGITPQTIKKAVLDIAAMKHDTGVKKIDASKIPTESLDRVIGELEVEMDLASQNLEFEKAADLRDQIDALQELKSQGKTRVKKK